MIKLEKITKEYKGSGYETHVLNELNLEIADGDFVGIIGKSGCGKSTLLNIIGCLDKADSGNYILDDKEIQSMSSGAFDRYRREKISFVFQNYELLDKYTVKENIELPLNVKNMKKKEKNQKINEIAEYLGIEKLLNKYPNQISGGEKQRVAIARAYVMDTPYILADEPTGALDDENSDMIIKLLGKINKKGKTVIVVSHDIDIVKQCNYIMQMQDGKIYRK